jgi:hypothetical protein
MKSQASNAAEAAKAKAKKANEDAAAAAACAAAAPAAAAVPKQPAQKKKKRPTGNKSGGESEGEDALRERKPLSVSPKTVQGRHTTQLRNHLRRWCKFIDFFKGMAEDVDIDPCEFFPTEEQAAMNGAPARPGKIGAEGINTDALTRGFIVKALPKRKYIQDNLFPRIVLKFENGIDHEIDTNAPAMRAKQSQGQAKRQKTTGGFGDGLSSGVDTGASEAEAESDNDDEANAAGAGAAGAMSILVGAAPRHSPHSSWSQKKKNKAQQKPQAFALPGSQCKCLLGHNMAVLTTGVGSSQKDHGLSAIQCSLCGKGIETNTNNAKTCGDARSQECWKHSVMCEECFRRLQAQYAAGPVPGSGEEESSVLGPSKI